MLLSSFFGRGHTSTRGDPPNLLCLCRMLGHRRAWGRTGRPVFLVAQRCKKKAALAGMGLPGGASVDAPKKKNRNPNGSRPIPNPYPGVGPGLAFRPSPHLVSCWFIVAQDPSALYGKYNVVSRMFPRRGKKNGLLQAGAGRRGTRVSAVNDEGPTSEGPKGAHPSKFPGGNARGERKKTRNRNQYVIGRKKQKK
jgi:hypothetical protein